MAEIVIIGGGVGGVVAAKRLRRSLGGGHRITVLDRARDHLFQPSLLWVADGTRRPEGLSRPLSRLNRRGVSFRFGAVQGLDVSARKVRVADGEVPYDYLLLSPGAELRPEALPGLAQGGRNLYTLDGAAGLNADLSRFPGGRLVVLVVAMPFKCPAAPYEAAMLLEARLRAQGVRGRSEVAVYTPEPQPMPVAGPALGAAVREMLTARGIEYFPGHKPVAVEPGSRTIRFETGAVASYDLLAYVPPHAAPAFVVDAGLAPAGGWVKVDPKTLATPFERVWAVGDVTGIPLPSGKMLPKAGVFAEGQAEVVARNVAALVRGTAPAAEFSGEGACFVEMGGGRAGFASGNFYATPDPVVRLKTPGRRWHWAKVLLERTWFPRWL
jgi:sulfide:quinone oxidoreductase